MAFQYRDLDVIADLEARPAVDRRDARFATDGAIAHDTTLKHSRGILRRTILAGPGVDHHLDGWPDVDDL